MVTQTHAICRTKPGVRGHCSDGGGHWKEVAHAACLLGTCEGSLALKGFEAIVKGKSTVLGKEPKLQITVAVVYINQGIGLLSAGNMPDEVGGTGCWLFYAAAVSPRR